MRNHEEKYYIDILKKYDSETDWEFPSDFNWKEVEKNTLDFISEFQKKTSLFNVHVDDQVQDASHHLTFSFKSNEHAIRLTQITFSNFGNMITISDIDLLDDKTLSTLTSLTEKYGFQYIPIEILLRPYNGKLEKFEGEWFNRFFDYL